MNADELASLTEKAARLIAGGGGLRALAQLLADETHGTVLIEDEQWRHVALAESRAGLGPLPPSFAPYFQQAATMSGNGQVIRTSVSSGVQALCVPMPASGDGDCPGYVTLFLRSSSRGDATPALRVAASAAAMEYARRGMGRGQARTVFWQRFLGGKIGDVADLRAAAQSAGVTLAPGYVAGVFDLEGAVAQTCREVVAQALAPADAVCPLGALGSQVVALFPVRHQVDVARARQAAGNAVRDVPHQGSCKSISCGMGAYHNDLLELPLGVREAREALSLGRRLFGRGSLALYPDLGIYALLHAGADRQHFAAFAQSIMEPLQAYDRKHKTDLLATLQLYFEVGENVKEAAERLSVHRHTIFYRLNQIAQILKMDLRSPKGQLFLRAALAIRQMSSPEDAT